MNSNQVVSAELRTAIASRYSEAAAQLWQNTLAHSAVDWVRLASQALYSGLAPLLVEVIRDSAGLEIPGEVLTRLNRDYYETASYNYLMLDELAEISHRAGQLDIPFTVLKGSALLQTAYPHAALRPMVDLDILLPFDDLPTMQSILCERGYRADYPFPFDDRSGQIWNEVMMVKSSGVPLQVELHWHLLDNPYYSHRLKTDSLLESSEWIQFEGLQYRVLSIPLQIIHLSCHNHFHHLNQITRSGVDIAYLIHNCGYKVNWDALVSAALAYNVVWPVGKALEQAAEVWYANVPKDVLRSLGKVPSTAKERFFTVSQQSEFLKLLRTVLTLPTIQLRLNFLKGQLFPTRRYMNWRYGTSKSTPLLFAYSRRYVSGLGRFFRELMVPISGR